VVTKLTGAVLPQTFLKTHFWRAPLIWAAGASFYFYEIMLLVSPSVMKDPLMAEFGATGEQLGHLAAFYYYAYALMQIPVGILIDRFGPRILLTIAAILCSVGCFMFGSATNLFFAEISRMIMGLGGSFAVVGTLKIASIWFPINRFALLTGLMVAVGMMGAVAGQAPVAMLVKATGWRETMFIGGGIGAMLSILIWWLMGQSSHVQSLLSRTKKNNQLFQDILPGLLQIIRHPGVWLVSIYSGLMFVPTTGFGQLWGVPYIESTYGLSTENAGWVVSMIFFGWAAGGPLFGWISDKIGKRNPPMALAAVSTLLVMAAILYWPKSILMMQIFLFLLGACSSGFILAFSVVRELNPLHLTGTAIGFINTINNASGAIAQPILGKILDNHWSGTVSESGVRLFGLADYQYALSLIPACLILALVLVIFVRETHCQPVIKN
jgi:MFS family permease